MKLTNCIGLISAAFLGFVIPATALADQVAIGTSQDNTLYEDGSGSLSNGAGKHFFVGRTLQPRLRRALMAFDIADAIPAGSTINSVQLTLHMSRTIAGVSTLRLHPLTANWGEGTSQAGGAEGGGGQATTGDATWRHTFWNTDFWANQGGDFSGQVSAAAAVGGTNFYTWGSNSEMVADVQDWLDTPETNFGWILIGDEKTEPSAKRFDTKENPVQNNRPKLVIDFTPPANDETVCPNAAVFNRGLVTDGTIANICDSDDVYWKLQPDVLVATIIAPINVILTGNVIGEGPPSEVNFILETHATEVGVVLRADVFNYVTMSFEGRVIPNIPTTDTVYTIVRDTSAGDYISKTGELKIRIAYLRPEGVPPFWFVNLDQAVWNVIR